MRKRFLLWDNPQDAIITIVLVLMAVGAINIFSASFVVAEAMFNNGYHYLFRYMFFGCLGLVAAWLIGWKMDYHKFLNYNNLIFGGCMAVLLAVDLFGKTTKGAQRWLVIGGFSTQPSEFVKLGVILIGAAYLGNLMVEGLRPHLLKFKVNIAFLEGLALTIMVLIQPDMGTASIIMGLMIMLYIIAGLPLKEVFVMLGLGLIAVVVAVGIAPYRLQRVLIWLDPWADAQGNGYQAVQSFVSIGSGGLIGNSFGMGSGKFFFLPEAHTDFAFAIFCQEWGFLGALCLISVFLLLGLAIYRVAQATTDRAGFLLVTGANFLIVGQAIANMAMVTGLLPVIGVPLSFISYGGTSLIATLIAVGLVISVYRTELKKEREEEEKKPAFLRNTNNRFRRPTIVPPRNTPPINPQGRWH